MKLVFVDSIPDPAPFGKPSTKHIVLDELAANPGRWAILAEGRKHGGALFSNWKRIGWKRPERFEFATRSNGGRVLLYGRCVGMKAPR